MLGVACFMEEGKVIRLASERPDDEPYFTGNPDRRTESAWVLTGARFVIDEDVALGLSHYTQADHRRAVNTKHPRRREPRFIARVVQEVRGVGPRGLIQTDAQIRLQGLAQPRDIGRFRSSQQGAAPSLELLQVKAQEI